MLRSLVGSEMCIRDSDSDEAHKLTLRRLRRLSKDKGYKEASAAEVSAQFSLAKLALCDTAKFESILGTATWPENLTVMKHKILYTSEMDSDLRSYEGNGRDILPCLLREYRMSYPDDAARHIALYNSTCAIQDAPAENSTGP